MGNNQIYIPLILACILGSTSVYQSSSNWLGENLNRNQSESSFIQSRHHLNRNVSHKPEGMDSELGLKLNNAVTAFVNQTRSTVLNIARHGNFTLIQFGLLCAVGAMAAGAATLVAEGLVFREREYEIDQYNRLKKGQMNHKIFNEYANGNYGNAY